MEVLRLLTQCGVPADVRGLRHKAPLHLAASQGHGAVVDTLLSSGVSCSFNSMIPFNGKLCRGLNLAKNARRPSKSIGNIFLIR